MSTNNSQDERLKKQVLCVWEPDKPSFSIMPKISQTW